MAGKPKVPKHGTVVGVIQPWLYWQWFSTGIAPRRRMLISHWYCVGVKGVSCWVYGLVGDRIRFRSLDLVLRQGCCNYNGLFSVVITGYGSSPRGFVSAGYLQTGCSFLWTFSQDEKSDAR